MRVLILSDIHANLVALETVLTNAAGQYDTVWCLGDVVGYGPCPNECIDLVRARAELCVMGNHDWAVLDRPGINVEDFNPQARQAVLWTREQLTPQNRAYLDSLPHVPLHPPQTDQILITHASPREPVWEYILTPLIALENFAVFDEPICLVGHTHKPAIYRWRLHSDEPLNGDYRPATVDYLLPQAGQAVYLATSATQRLIVNPGSVGQPRDNDARAAYAILDLENMTWLYERVAYPVELTQSQMRTAGLPKRLIDRLSFGS
ncbi:MAG: metallophosphoesterase family protein [Caldilineaceae bacterium]|nr:metallophosphoesterase family protein [Caldilineaceae bacterium]